MTLPWLLNYLQTTSTNAYSDEMLETATIVMDCIQSIVEHLSVLCDDSITDHDYFKPFLLDILMLFINPTLNRDNISDPHVLTDSKVLNKCVTLLRVAIQGVNRCINILEYLLIECCVLVRLDWLLSRRSNTRFGH